jgi:hypothetical protein
MGNLWSCFLLMALAGIGGLLLDGLLPSHTGVAVAYLSIGLWQVIAAKALFPAARNPDGIGYALFLMVTTAAVVFICFGLWTGFGRPQGWRDVYFPILSYLACAHGAAVAIMLHRLGYSEEKPLAYTVAAGVVLVMSILLVLLFGIIPVG